MRHFALLALFPLVASPRASAAAFEASAGVGYVPASKAQVTGVEGECVFRGATAGASLLWAGKNDSWFGAFVGAEMLRNTFTEDDAEETMTTKDIGMLGALMSSKHPFGAYAGLGYTQTVIEQASPVEREVSFTGYVIKLGLHLGVAGDKNHGFFVRPEGVVRTFDNGKDASDEGAKLLPFLQTSSAIFVGGFLRF